MSYCGFLLPGSLILQAKHWSWYYGCKVQQQKLICCLKRNERAGKVQSCWNAPWERFHIFPLLSWRAPSSTRTIFILKLTQWSIQKLNFNSIKASLPVGHAFVGIIVSLCFSDLSSLNMNCTGTQTLSRAGGNILIQPHKGKRNHDRVTGRSGLECLQRPVPNSH